MYNCIVPFYKAEKCFVGLEEKFKSIKLFHSLNFLWHLILRLVWVRMPENVSVRRRMPAILVPPPPLLCKQFTFFIPQIIVAVSIDCVDNIFKLHFFNYKTVSCQFSPHFDSFDKHLQSLGMLDVFETSQPIHMIQTSGCGGRETLSLRFCPMDVVCPTTNIGSWCSPVWRHRHHHHHHHHQQRRKNTYLRRKIPILDSICSERVFPFILGFSAKSARK